MNDALGSGLLHEGRGPDQTLLGLICRFLGHSSSQRLDRFLCVAFVTTVSHSSYFALSSPLKG